MNTDFLLHSNINRLYTSIKDRIQSQINYNIDKREQKYRNIINKLLIKISKKDDLGIDDLNSMAMQTICPFLISKIQNKKLPDISFSQNRNVDRIIPQRSGGITKTNSREEYQSFLDNSNLTNSNVIEKENENDSISDNMEGFVNYDHSSENTLEGFEMNNMDNRIEDTIEHFDTTTPKETLPSEIDDANKQLVQELGEYKEATEKTGILFNELRSKQILINELEDKTGYFKDKDKDNITKEHVTDWINNNITTDNNYKDDFLKWVDGWKNTYTEKYLIKVLQTFGTITYTYNEYLVYTALMNKIKYLQEIEVASDSDKNVFDKKDVPVLIKNENNKFIEKLGEGTIDKSVFEKITYLLEDIVNVDRDKQKITFNNNQKKHLLKYHKNIQVEVNKKLKNVSDYAVVREKKDVEDVKTILSELLVQIEGKNQAIDQLRKELDGLKHINKESVDNFLDIYQVSSGEITHKTMLLLDIVRHAENPKSENIFVNGPTPETSNIIDFEILLSEPITLPVETEVILDYFSIYKFKGTTRSTGKLVKPMEHFDSFVVKITGNNFNSIKQYSNTRSFSEEATIVVPNDGFGFSDENEGSGIAATNNQESYTVKPKSNFVGILKGGGTITRLKITLMGTFVAEPAQSNNTGANTWTYLYPYSTLSRCKIGLMLNPLKPSRVQPRPQYQTMTENKP